MTGTFAWSRGDILLEPRFRRIVFGMAESRHDKCRHQHESRTRPPLAGSVENIESPDYRTEVGTYCQ